ncbi:MAG TPA: exodeoxyribonuclease VII large subunit [Fibrobacteria bacterium]|nr:exodeoxyribonuclease VII large subunit [Fibrobacteria bacterium]
MDPDSKIKDERAKPSEAKAGFPQGIGRLPGINSSFEKPVAFRTVLLSINELMKQLYNKVAYRFPIFTQGTIVDVSEGTGTFHYFGLVDSGHYLPAKIKDEGCIFQTLQEGFPVIVKGYFNLQSPPNRPYAFEIRLNVIELNHTFPLEPTTAQNQATKKPAPERIRSIGLVTSPNSEAISDFHEGLKKSRRFLNIEVHGVNLLNAESIAAGIKEADAKGYDVLVLTRGGGPDLYLFNDPAIAAAVRTCKTFTITGLGHANNRTECDRVSDSSVETPTSAGVYIRKLVSEKYFTEKSKALNPQPTGPVAPMNPWKKHFKIFLEGSGAAVFAGVVAAFEFFLKIAKRITLAILFSLAGMLALLIFSLLLRGC